MEELPERCPLVGEKDGNWYREEDSCLEDFDFMKE